MPPEAQKTVIEVVRELGRYSVDAFHFLHKGLDYTVQKLHGPPPEGLQELHLWLDAKGADPGSLADLVESGEVSPDVATLIDQLGGVEVVANRLNRHVSGEALCWGLRDLALRRWGMMASTVLGHWGIRSTRDFGRMVFALVDNGLLQKQPDDRIEDFDDVYDFEMAFDGSYKITLSKPGSSESETE